MTPTIVSQQNCLPHLFNACGKQQEVRVVKGSEQEQREGHTHI